MNFIFLNFYIFINLKKNLNLFKFASVFEKKRDHFYCFLIRVDLLLENLYDETNFTKGNIFV